MSALAAEQRKLSERYHEQMLEYVDLGLRSPSDLQEVKARLQSDIYQETVKKKTERLSFLALKELLQMRDSDSLSVSDREGDDGELPLLAGYSAPEVYAESETALPEFRMMDLREQASRKSLAIASGAFSPSIRADFSLYSSYYDTERDAGRAHLLVRAADEKQLEQIYRSAGIFPYIQRFVPLYGSQERAFPPATDKE